MKGARGKGAARNTAEALRPADDSEEFRATFKKENPNVKAVSAVGKAAGEKWKSLSEDEGQQQPDDEEEEEEEEDEDDD
ncbi:High mobility group box domain - like 7 [Theobroma cacao]|nr:High mobility group box domain - like 7 [Theobroma cacao]